MNLLTLLEDLDEELSKSASVPLTGKRLVDVEKCLDIVSELRVSLPDDVRGKFRGSLSRVVNEGANGLICLIL